MCFIIVKYVIKYKTRFSLHSRFRVEYLLKAVFTESEVILPSALNGKPNSFKISSPTSMLNRWLNINSISVNCKTFCGNFIN